MSQKKTPQRRCVACRSMKDKNELIRIVKNKNGEISLDATGKAQGRGAYICKDLSCLLKAEKSGALNRAFSANVDSSVYEKLKEELGKID